MKYLKLQNDGELDIRLIALMGGSTKTNDKFKIGQFGTGLKYTLAYLFRNNIDFKVFIGETEAVLNIETETIKDENYDIICINNQRTSITTKMGLDWTAWMIIRELWCNCLDEGGANRVVTEITAGEAGKTIFFIQIDKEFQEVLNNWDKYFIHDTEPIFENSQYKIYSGGTRLRLYKQGVLIHEGPENFPSLFSYDIKDADINELREFKGTPAFEIFKALKDANEVVITTFLQSLNDEQYEAKMSYDWWYNFGNKWKQTIGNAKLIHQEAIENIEARGVEIDLTGTICIPKNVFSFLTKQFPGIGALRVADKVNEFYEIHSEALSDKLNECLSILDVCEYPVNAELKFVFGVFGDKCKNASINLDTKEVLLSESMLDKSMFDFCATLIEENEHFKTGHPDCSRQFQQHFINLFAKTLFDKNAVKL